MWVSRLASTEAGSTGVLRLGWCCRLRLERGEEGYIVGAQMFNLIAAELLFAAIFIVVLIASLPDAPWDLLLYGGLALMIIFPVFFYPFSKTVFLAFDLLFRRPTPEDFLELSS